MAGSVLLVFQCVFGAIVPCCPTSVGWHSGGITKESKTFISSMFQRQEWSTFLKSVFFRPIPFTFSVSFSVELSLLHPYSFWHRFLMHYFYLPEYSRNYMLMLLYGYFFWSHHKVCIEPEVRNASLNVRKSTASKLGFCGAEHLQNVFNDHKNTWLFFRVCAVVLLWKWGLLAVQAKGGRREIFWFFQFLSSSLH